MKMLTIDWNALESAFEETGEYGSLEEVANYFDTQTGQVVTIDEELSLAVNEVMEELGDAVDDDADWTEDDIGNTESYKELVEWMKPHAFAAIQIEQTADSARFKAIPRFDSHEALHWLEAFVGTVEDDKIRARLGAALNHRKPIRSFRAAMTGDRRLERQWGLFESARRHESITDWLASINIQPANPAESSKLLPLPELRRIMFAEVRRFVKLARELSGVLRIDLIGSLASDKEFPKDIDLLITVTDDCDLTALATLGRRLAGHMATHRAGAEIFLASPDGQYLGRTCAWKKCGPGNRNSCDALSCGKRDYLHDDLKTIRLSEQQIQHPSVQLWPQITALPDCPADLLELLIQPLSEDNSR